ncbi:hypothetical protein T265_05711 [Opisthorchis viverrini]|uniref:Uncharacterized protein n=1 Tax=Opisthorchis viverrini TaxID=6198 RepID=A0A074ZJM7_OPIVI|nr:hypothetical protein T265_05711 [Opisthorchis viverrini]KER27176.1 hypothetical protein T265_05711 [Opisthorchis viverrini]
MQVANVDIYSPMFASNFVYPGDRKRTLGLQWRRGLRPLRREYKKPINVIIDSMTSVLNSGASLPYNHDLFENLIKIRSAVAPFWFLTAMALERSMRTGIRPGCPSLDRGIRDAVVGLEPRTFRSQPTMAVFLDSGAVFDSVNRRHYGTVFRTSVSPISFFVVDTIMEGALLAPTAYGVEVLPGCLLTDIEHADDNTSGI